MLTAKRAKHLLLLIRLLLCFGLILTVCSIGSRFAANAMVNSSYQKLISISAASGPELCRQSYREAISLLPQASEPYIRLLQVYGDDGTFSKAESEEFLALYNANHLSLTQDADYVTLHCNAGLLYVSGYEDAAMRLKLAYPFFQAALDAMPEDDPQRASISCYCQIGDFYRSYIWTTAVREIPEAEVTGLLTSIEDTISSLTADSDNPDAIYHRISFSTAVCNLFLDQRTVLAATAEEDAVVGILDQIYGGLPAPESLRTNQLREMVETLLENRSGYYDLLERAFDRAGGDHHAG